jgi:hypothetical protein
MIRVKYSSNNSGGGWWLTDQNWIDLHKAGWQLKKHPDDNVYSSDGRGCDENWELDPHKAIEDNRRWLGAICTSARKDFKTMREAIEEFENITGENVAAEGCNCCSQPNSFSGEDLDTGKYVSGPSIEVSTSLVWED